MKTPLSAQEAGRIPSPALLFDRAAIARNIARTIQRAGTADRLRPHVKTHKTREIARMWLKAGVTKHKCATLAEAEMLASVGVPDILVAYPMVGPNCDRFARLVRHYPETRFGVTIDHPASLRQLQEAFAQARDVVDVYLDVNCGMGRTGIELGGDAARLCREIHASPPFRLVGLHVYDGHNNQTGIEPRRELAHAIIRSVQEFVACLSRDGLSLSRIVIGGTPSFPVHAEQSIAGLELSPGTLSLHDANYDSRYPELGLEFGAILLTRVVSRPSFDRMTLDLGYKAVSPDSPLATRCRLPDIPDAEFVVHSEEHLTLRTESAARFSPGDVVYAIPAHVCPTVALHKAAWVVEGGSVVDRWEIAARDRDITV